MRIITLACFLAACASVPGPAHVQCDTIRHLIDDTIQHGPDARDITAVGHVTNERAFVYTRRPDGTRAKELWKRTDGAWTLAAAAPMTGAPPPAPSCTQPTRS